MIKTELPCYVNKCEQNVEKYLKTEIVLLNCDTFPQIKGPEIEI